MYDSIRVNDGHILYAFVLYGEKCIRWHHLNSLRNAILLSAFFKLQIFYPILPSFLPLSPHILLSTLSWSFYSFPSTSLHSFSQLLLRCTLHRLPYKMYFRGGINTKQTVVILNTVLNAKASSRTVLISLILLKGTQMQFNTMTVISLLLTYTYTVGLCT